METHDLVVIGSGPAGYSAAIYAARAQLSPLVFAGESNGGQLMLTTDVENFPGFPHGVMGPELMMHMREQAERFGAVIHDTYVEAVDFSKRPFIVTSRGVQWQARSVILATGAEAVLLNVPGEREYLGRGVSTCAVCDAAFYRNKNVYVVGGGDAAMEDTLALTKFATKITLLHRRDQFRASKIMQERVLKDPGGKVSVRWNTAAVEVKGDGQRITSIVVRDVVTQAVEELSADGLFIAIGHTPTTGFLKNQVKLDDKGYVVTRMSWSKLGRELGQAYDDKGMLLFPTMTSVEGVFAGGDNVDFRYRQATTAAGMGVMAALDAAWWLERG